MDTAFVDLLSEPSFIVDDSRTIVQANQPFFSTFGLKPDDVIDKMVCEEACPTSLCGTTDCPVTKAGRIRKPASADFIHHGKGKEIRHFRAAASKINSGGKRHLVTLSETTDQKRTEARLRQMETDLDVIPTPIMEIDKKYTITYMNPAGAAVVGSTPDEVLGKKCFDLFKTPHCKTEKCACTRAMKTDSVVTEQTIARPSDGVIIPIKYTGAAIKDAKGNISGAIEYVLDMTEEMKQRQAADEKIENLNTIPTPIMSIDTEHTITFMNPAGAGVLGLTPDEAMGKKCYDLFKTPHCKTEKCACTRAMKTDSVVTEQTIARPSEGVIIPIKYTGAPIKDAKGNIKGALEYVLDVTEEMKQRQAADEKIENLNTIPTPIMAIDTEHAITFMNPAGAGVLGLTPDEAVGKKCYDLFKTPHCKTEKCACTRAMKTDSVVTEQTIARPSDGVIIPIKYTGAPIKDAKGNIKGALEYVLDVTEEMKQRQAADEKIENLNTIPTPIMAIDTEHTITFMNPAGANVVGSPPDDLIGRKCYDIFKTDHCRTENCACTQAMKTDKVVSGKTIAQPNGRAIPIKYTGSPIKDAKGNVKGALEYILDLTAEKAVQDLIAKACEDVQGQVDASKSRMDQAGDSMARMNTMILEGVTKLDNAASRVRAMVKSSEDMLTLAKSSSELTAEMAQEAEIGQEAGRDAGGKLADINETMAKNNRIVKELVEQLEKISGFVDIIKEIASQTNLLAFNAAIEAARAGDAGRGFAVVADEVRKLAEKSSQSAVDISNIVKNVENESRATITAMEKGMTTLQDGGMVINTALSAMEKISEGIVEISTSVENLHTHVEALSADGHEVRKHIDDVVASSKENQRSTEAINNGLVETMASLDLLVESSRNLKESVANLS